MITKVKGEAIKEGSIPYSALATEVKEKIDKLVNITYANLKSLRDNSQLIPGQQYRIVDYTTTTTQEDTLSAGHQFDVIVTADSENTLNESARACKSEFSIERYKDAIYAEKNNDVYDTYPVEYMGEFVYNGKKYYRYYIDAYSAEILIDWEGSSSLQSITGTIDGYPEYKYWKTSNFIRRNEYNDVWGEWNNTDSEDIIVKNNIPNYSYFANSDLNAWELKYSLDNDLTRFEWAQGMELSPVSKRKIISVNNDDEGYSYIYLRYPEGDENGKYAWVYDNGGDDDSIKEYIGRGEEDFDSDDCIYTTTENPSVGYSIDDYNIVIEVSSTAEEGKGVIYYMKDEWNNECPYDFKNIMFRVTSGQSEYNYYTFHNLYGGYNDDSIENGTYGNVIKPYTINRIYINNIRFGSGCHNNTFSYNCYNNTLGDNCSNNSFGSECYNNSFGFSCYRNNFGNYCNYISFGPGCDNNSFGNYCYRNNFGSYCECNSFGNYCNYNSFGYQCSRNNFGNGCTDNSFGNYCSNNTFGNGCAWNCFGTSSTNLKSYYRYIIFDNGNSHINLNCTSTTSSSKYFQNVRIGLGVSGTSSIRKTISNSETNQNYETLYKPANSQTITI